MNNLYLFARIAGIAVAISAEEVEAVVRISSISPIPAVPPYVTGLAALRSRVLTVIDVARLIDPARQTAAENPFAVVCDIAGHSYGLLVDEVRDICEVHNKPGPIRGCLTEQWQRYGQGVVPYADEPHLFVSIEKFIENAAIPVAA